MFTARYAQMPYITQIRFVSKILNVFCILGGGCKHETSGLLFL